MRRLTRFTSLRRLISGLAAVSLFSGSAIAQTLVLRGNVTTSDGQPLAGASVAIPELQIGTAVGDDGSYAVIVPSTRIRDQRATLRARAIGFVPSSVSILVTAGTQEHSFSLRRDVNRLEEVVVTGSLTGLEQKKLAFSVSRLEAEDMPVPATNALLQLQAKVPGAHVVQPTGRPGAGPAILLRGPKSLDASGRSQEPLLIVDGVVLNTTAQDINPQDIESIEVVKGAAASSLYGSRAGAGVIQITTRSGRSGAQGTQVTVRSEFGFKDVQGEYPYSTRHFLMMDENNERFCIKVVGLPPCSRTVDLEEEARRINDTPQAGSLPPYPFERDYGIASAPSRPELKGLFQVASWPKVYNPIEQIVTNEAFSSSAVDVASRMGSTGYFASLSHLGEKGAMKFLRGYTRSSGRLNLSHASSSRASIDLTSLVSRSRQYPAQSGGAGFVEIDDFFRVTRVPPNVDLLRRDSQGRLYIRSNPLIHGGQNANPLYDHENHEGRLDTDRAVVSGTIRYAPVSFLSFEALTGADRRRTTEFVFRDRGYRTNNQLFPAGLTGLVLNRAGSDVSYNALLTAKLDGHPTDRLRTTITSRVSYEHQDVEWAAAYGENLAVPGIRTLANATANKDVWDERWSVRAKGALVGMLAEYSERYIFDALLRYDGSSLFGADERWHAYYRGSFAWRTSEENWWRIASVSDLKLRASVGTAGGRPSFSAQYETFNIAASGLVAARTLGNRRLKPEHTTETEVGFDAELWNRFGLSFTYSRAITADQILLAPAPVASGFASRWTNAGTLDGRTYELALRLPLLRRETATWDAQLAWDRNRTYISSLQIPPTIVGAGTRSGGGLTFLYAAGERFGTIYGNRFATRCSDLPQPFASDCGDGREWQINDEGYLVWVGTGYSWRDGVTLNLWQTMRPGCLRNGVAIDATGEVECVARGGMVNTPWGVPEVHWGMPVLIRDSTAAPRQMPLGNTLPDYRVSLAQTLRWRRLSVYALLDGSVGNDVFNQERNWSFGDFMVREQDQIGKTPETGKPIGYYWRAGRPTNSFGVGGFYHIGTLATNRTVEDGSYVKLREVSVTYDVGELRVVPGRWAVSVVGRNLHTWTRFSGWDPEIGLAGGPMNSAAITAGAMFQYPPTRAFTLALTGRFQ